MILTTLRQLLIEHAIAVSDLEYTANNYDDYGRLIDETLPTITTALCEIGSYQDKIYFVFIVESTSVSAELLRQLCSGTNLQIYSLIRCQTNLYPAAGFDIELCQQQMQQEALVQFEFQYAETNAADLLQHYFGLKALLQEGNANIVNQLSVDWINRVRTTY